MTNKEFMDLIAVCCGDRPKPWPGAAAEAIQAYESVRAENLELKTQVLLLEHNLKKANQAIERTERERNVLRDAYDKLLLEQQGRG